ncbi:MAG: hypothetical protein GY705_19175 [Bacteroidetes bacterium]|nr:hypothetical protein [Bacteroidota bacterium]
MKVFVLLAFSVFFLGKSTAQICILGIQSGITMYHGDVSSPHFVPVDPSEVGMNAGIFFRYSINDHWTMRINLNRASLSGTDFNYPDSEWRMNRGFRFSTKLHEFSLLTEYGILQQSRIEDTESAGKFVAPFLFTGIGMVLADPQAVFNEHNGIDDKIEKDKENGSPNLNIVVLVGIGYKMDLSKKSHFGFEIGGRIPFTDYLDGISEAGNPKSKDFYFFGSVMIGYKLEKRGEKEKINHLDFY